MFELTEEEFNYCEETERRKHDEKVRELEGTDINVYSNEE